MASASSLWEFVYYRARRWFHESSVAFVTAVFFIPSVFFILQQGFQIAVKAQSVVTANHFTTALATPLFLLLFYEYIHSMVFNAVKVLHHAHMIFGAVPFVQVFEPLAGKVCALKAIRFYTGLMPIEHR